jgi:hypothetical protein
MVRWNASTEHVKTPAANVKFRRAKNGNSSNLPSIFSPRDDYRMNDPVR